MKKSSHIELLRIIALICIIFNHTGENGYLFFEITNNQYLQMLSIFLSNLCKIGVPLFFMISGALLLPKNETIKELFVKRILRFAIIIVLFSFIYYIRLYIQHPEYGFSLVFFLKLIYSQPFITPFWFLYSYFAFLLMLPFLRKMALALSDGEYVFFSVLAVAFLFIFRILEYMLGSSTYINIVLLSTNIVFPLLGYFIEYRLSKKVYSLKGIFVVSFLLLFNGICCSFLTLFAYRKNGTFDVIFIENFTLISAIAVFYIVKYCCNRAHVLKMTIKGQFVNKFILYLGSCTFCTYLFEEMLRIDIFIKLFNVLCPLFPTLLVCIPYIICIFTTGVFISTILKHVPGAKFLGL